ncbi:GntR family transcriptional regulator [Allonocardiopsis opalescens]|uniref:GntR family transcriptional regulator n=2 Tax=Allonocardiopsis opalescens TaxID=1144618 RepID=A0A2T0Q0E9_9ACTN|nr:GntR family transcriptional regulator [Allonocardiopsis opalescens]
MPFYHQLKELLLAEIERKGLRPGDRIPGDHELCLTYGVSRTVVRQALAELEFAGVVERVKGRGTFVARPKVTEGLAQSLTGLFEDAAARGSHLRSEVRALEERPAEIQVAHDLGVAPGHPVVFLERLRFIDDVPWAHTFTYVPAELAPGLLAEDFTEASLYHLLERRYGVVLARARRTIEAAVANAELARNLDIRVGDPVLVLRSVCVDGDGRPVEHFVAFHRGDRSRMEVDLTRSPRRASRSPLMVVTD